MRLALRGSSWVHVFCPRVNMICVRMAQIHSTRRELTAKRLVCYK